jgi:Skp family chaperone for outer membrane proteins
MKAFLPLGLLGIFTWSCAAGELKVATIDLQRVLTDYYKAQEVAKQLKEKQTLFLKELDGMRLEGRKLMQEAEALRELAANDALSATAREEKKKGFQTKLTDLRAFEVRYDDLKAQREAELQLQATQSNKRILEDVMSATRFVGEKEGFNLILNASKANPVASDVLFSRNVSDLTEKIVASLNTMKPMQTEAPSGTNNVKPR